MTNTNESISSRVKVLRLSDFITGKTSLTKPVPEPTLLDEKRPRRGRNATKHMTGEVSSFKASNKIAASNLKQKKVKDNSDKEADVLWMHEKKQQYFKELEKVKLPKLKDELLKMPLTDLRRPLIEKEIRDIENKTEEIEYMLKTHHIITEYTLLMSKTNTEDEKKEAEEQATGPMSMYVAKINNVEKQRLTEAYCRTVNNGLMVNTKRLYFDTNNCEDCNGELVNTDGFTSCMECGKVSEKSVHDFKVSYNDFQDISVRIPFAYKRINRFNEILASFQGKENTIIPDYVMNALRKEIEKEPDYDYSSIDNKKLRNHLKRLNFPDFYEHIPQIKIKLNGISAVQIPMEVEEMLRKMFKDIQDPFEEIRPKVRPERCSFLSYSYVFYKFFELLDLPEYLPYFTLLKSAEKLRIQDDIWEGICEILGWEFIPSP